MAIVAPILIKLDIIKNLGKRFLVNMYFLSTFTASATEAEFFRDNALAVA